MSNKENEKMWFKHDACEAERVWSTLLFAPINLYVSNDFKKCKYEINFELPIKSLDNQTLTNIISNGIIRHEPGCADIQFTDEEWVSQYIEDMSLNIQMTLMCMMSNALNINKNSDEEFVLLQMMHYAVPIDHIAERFIVEIVDDVEGL